MSNQNLEDAIEGEKAEEIREAIKEKEREGTKYGDKL